MNNKIIVLTEEGKMKEIEILRVFNVDGYDKDYILYTLNEEADENNLITYISILSGSDGNYELQAIEDEKEEMLVDRALEEDINEVLNSSEN